MLIIPLASGWLLFLPVILPQVITAYHSFWIVITAYFLVLLTRTFMLALISKVHLPLCLL